MVLLFMHVMVLTGHWPAAEPLAKWDGIPA